MAARKRTCASCPQVFSSGRSGGRNPRESGTGCTSFTWKSAVGVEVVTSMATVTGLRGETIPRCQQWDSVSADGSTPPTALIGRPLQVMVHPIHSFINTHEAAKKHTHRCPVCLSVCLSVCNVGVLWPNGWMQQDTTWYGGRSRPRQHSVR